MTWASKVAASKKEVPLNAINAQSNQLVGNHQVPGIPDGRSKGSKENIQKVESSVVFKPEAANGGKVKNVPKNNLSFGNFTEQTVGNPVPVQRTSPIAPVPVRFYC